jgi:hypothetical protein
MHGWAKEAGHWAEVGEWPCGGLVGLGVGYAVESNLGSRWG